MNIVFLLFLISQVNCLHIQFFKNPNYEGFISEHVIPPEKEANNCIHLNERTSISSIKTDKCVVLYNAASCRTSKVYRILTIGRRVDYDEPNFKTPAWSFHVCSQEMGGGPLLDVDFFDPPAQGGNLSYKNVCGCRNIPPSFIGDHRLTSIDNHANDMLLFGKENCEGSSALFNRRGQVVLENGRIFNPLDGTYNPLVAEGIRPFRSFSFSLNCTKLDASVHKFVFKNDDHAVEIQNNTLSLESVFRNDGAAKLTQQYSVSKKVRENVQYVKSAGWSNTHTVGVAVGLETEGEVGVPFLAKSKVRASLKVNYQWQGSSSTTETETRTAETEETFSISQGIDIPPCTEYSVSSFVTMVKDREIDYIAYAKLTGIAGYQKMNKNELKNSLYSEMNYVRDLDEDSIEVEVPGKMYATYGIKTFVVGKGKPIPGCLSSSLMGMSNNNSTDFVIEVPFVRE